MLISSVFKRAAIAAVASVSMLSAAAQAQQSAELPSLIKIVVPFSPGASTDVVGRAVANLLAKELGTDVIVENKPGASGMIGARSVVRGPKDGSELLVISNSVITAAATLRNMPIDITKDIMPVAVLAEGPMIITVPSSSPIKTPQDLVAAAKAQPGVLNYGSGGMGTIMHMGVELFAEMADVKLTHVPYKGASQAVVDMTGGSLDLLLGAYSTFAPVLDSGRARAIAVTTEKPSPAFPDLPPLASVTPGYSTDIWIGLWGPEGVPAEVMERLNKAVANVTHSEEYAHILKSAGHQPSRATPAELSARVKTELENWKRVAKNNNIVID